MLKPVSKAQVRPYIGKEIMAYKKDGSLVTGKLVRLSGNRLIIEATKGKKVKTKAIIPLVLFDLLAIGTAPFAYGAYGGFGPGFGYSAPGAGVAPFGIPAGGFFW